MSRWEAHSNTSVKLDNSRIAALSNLFLGPSTELSLLASPRLLSKTSCTTASAATWGCANRICVSTGSSHVVLPLFHPHSSEEGAKRAHSLELPVLGSTKALSLKNQTTFLLVLGCSQSPVYRACSHTHNYIIYLPPLA